MRKRVYFVAFALVALLVGLLSIAGRRPAHDNARNERISLLSVSNWETLPRGGGSGFELPSSCPYSLRIAIFVYNRPDNFNRLWSTIMDAWPTSCVSGIHIYHDHADDPSEKWNEQRDVLLKLEPPSLAPLTLHLARHRLGLRTSILGNWEPETDDNSELTLFLEDDIQLAAVALRYIEVLAETYFVTNQDPNLWGISLYSPFYNDVTTQLLTAPEMETTHPYIYQYPNSWGVVYTARSWRRLREFFLEWHFGPRGLDAPYIPNSMTNLWPSRTSWKMFMVRLFVEDGGYLLYPHVDMSCSRNEASVGEHVSENAVKWFNEHYSVNLVKDEDSSVVLTTSSGRLVDLDAFNAWREPVGSLAEMTDGVQRAALHDFDDVILAISVPSTDAAAMDALVQHYAQLPRVSRIIVLAPSKDPLERGCSTIEYPIKGSGRWSRPITVCFCANPINKYDVISVAVGVTTTSPLLVIENVERYSLVEMNGMLQGFREGGYLHIVTTKSSLRHVVEGSGGGLTESASFDNVQASDGAGNHYFVPLEGPFVISAALLEKALASIPSSIRSDAIDKTPFFAHLALYASAARYAPYRRHLAVTCEAVAGGSGGHQIEADTGDMLRDIGASIPNIRLFPPFSLWVKGVC